MSGVPVPKATTHVMLCYCFSVLLMRTYSLFNLHFTWHLHDFLSALDTMVSSHFRVRHWSDAVEKRL